MALGKTGIFSLEDVNIRHAQEVWPTAWGAAPASNTPIPGGSGKVYFCGGDNDGDLIQRFEITNDTANTVNKGTMSTPSTNRWSAMTTVNYGYLTTASSKTTIDRLTYANDTNSVAKGTQTGSRNQDGATSSPTHGYIIGGYDGGSNSSVQRYDFANDTGTAAQICSLATAAYDTMSSVGNKSYGWVGPKRIPGAPVNSQLYRIDYSNDTATTAIRGSVGSGWGSNATGNADYGWWGGGGPGSGRNDVYRVDYATDTGTGSPKGSLVSGRSEHACATGNTVYGYWNGGEPGSTNNTKSDRIDFSNDTATALQRSAVLTRLKNAHAICGGQDAVG